MAITIGRVGRDAIYGQVIDDLSGVQDVGLLLDSGDIAAALRHRHWFEDDWRLLDDLGWAPDPEADEFELTMSPVRLAGLVQRLNADAGTLLGDHLAETADDRDRAERLLIARTT